MATLSLVGTGGEWRGCGGSDDIYGSGVHFGVFWLFCVFCRLDYGCVVGTFTDRVFSSRVGWRVRFAKPK